MSFVLKNSTRKGKFRLSFPNIPNITPSISITTEQTVPLLLASIAFEELALAHVINADAEKLQFVLGTLDTETTLPSYATVTNLLDVNKSVQTTLRDVIKKEMLLEFKFENVLDLINTLPDGGQDRPKTNRVLVYGPSLGNADPNEATLAASLGFSVTVANEATWSSFTTTDFEQFDAIIIGDAKCVVGTTLLAAAEANKTTWSSVVTGPIYVQGTDPTFHEGSQPEAIDMIKNGISFAASGSGIGLYVSLGCYYADSPSNTPVNVLSEFGTFTVHGSQQESIQLLAPTHPAMTGLTNAGLSNWFNSTHEVFDSFPPSFTALARETTNGFTYIIARP